jgi:hypothetical protein
MRNNNIKKTLFIKKSSKSTNANLKYFYNHKHLPSSLFEAYNYFNRLSDYVELNHDRSIPLLFD